MIAYVEEPRVISFGPDNGSVVLYEVKPPTGEPRAGDPHVWFGGRGGLKGPFLPLLENADPSDVLRSTTIARKDLLANEERKVELTEMVALEVDQEGKVKQAYLSGSPISLKSLEESQNLDQDAILYVSPDTPISEIMRIRLSYSETPVVVIDDEELVGAISEEEILHGLLEKGRE